MPTIPLAFVLSMFGTTIIVYTIEMYFAAKNHRVGAYAFSIFLIFLNIFGIIIFYPLPARFGHLTPLILYTDPFNLSVNYCW